MTRLMGDAVHSEVAQLAAVPGLQLVAGYVTGTPDIQWTQDDWNRFPGIPHITIDQAYTGSPVATATVRDVETGAWTPANAVNRAGWSATRPTIYCNQNTLPAVLADGWRGDLWLAIVSWRPGDALPPAPGCTIVAVQSDYTNPNYDLSYVLDPAWPGTDPPQENDMLLVKGSDPGVYLLSGGKMAPVQDQLSLTAFQNAGIQMAQVSDATLTSMLADFPPGQPTVTVPPITVPPVTVTFPVQKFSGTLSPS